jgi:hypothetical protein
MENNGYLSSHKVEIIAAIAAVAIVYGTNSYYQYAMRETKKIEQEIAALQILERAQAKQLDDLVQASKQIPTSRKELTDLTKF